MQILEEVWGCGNWTAVLPLGGRRDKDEDRRRC